MNRIDLQKNIFKVIASQINPAEYKIFLFGSFAKGEDNRTSDIDIGIEGKYPLSPRIKFQITDELEKLKTLKRFDLVDFKSVSPNFYTKAKSTILYLN